MTDVSSPASALELEPVDAPSTAADDIAAGAGRVPVAAPPQDREIKGADAWLAAATREYESGWIDQPLWGGLLAQSGGDEVKTKIAYLQTRARVLRIAMRDKRSAKSARRVRSAPQSASQAEPPETGGGSPAQTKTALGSLPRAAMALGLVIVVAGAWFIATNQDAPAVPQSSTVPGVARTHPGKPAQAPNAGVPTSPEVAEEGFAAKLAKLRDAGNWNVLVLYASEWTRKEPANVDAWIQLSVGYAALRQFGDAFETATKATQLAPDNPRVWRNLGQVNVALGQPAEALHAFEQAVALNDQDVPSLVQLGLLNTQLARLPQAKAAFDKALSASPDDAGAMCGQVLIARQQGRPKEADVIAEKLQSLGRSCRDANESASVAVVATHPAAARSPPSRSR